MRHGVTLLRRLLLAGCTPRISPVYGNFCFHFAIDLFCFVLYFQADNGKDRGYGVDQYTIILDSLWKNSQPHGTRVNIEISGMVSDATTSPPDLSITLLCIVGVDGCTEQSTGVSSGGFLSTIATPTARHTTTTRDESSEPGRHNFLIILTYHIILDLDMKYYNRKSYWFG